jgi:hypothetical protein
VTTSKPKWNCTDERQWLAYVSERLATLKYEDMLRSLAKLTADLDPISQKQSVRHAWYLRLRNVFHQLDVLAARREARATGNRELLRKFVPGAEDWINEPRKRGQTRLQRKQAVDRERLAWAIEDVDRIREFWRQDYGPWKRRVEPSAVRLAALLNGVDEGKLEKAMDHPPSGNTSQSAA